MNLNLVKKGTRRIALRRILSGIVVVCFILMLSWLSLPAMAQGSIEDPQIKEASKWVEGPAADLMGAVSKLHAWAIIILLIILVVAAIMAAMGKTGMAISVAIGAVVLFGGFWVFSIIREPLDKNDLLPTSATYEITQQKGGRYLTLPATNLVNGGLELLATAIIPFMVCFGFMLAIAFASQGADPNALASYILGAIIVLGASIVASVFNVITST